MTIAADLVKIVKGNPKALIVRTMILVRPGFFRLAGRPLQGRLSGSRDNCRPHNILLGPDNHVRLFLKNLIAR
jgi:hypothetical protein